MLENQILLPDIRIQNYKISLFFYPYAIALILLPAILIEKQATDGLDYFLLWGFVKLSAFVVLYLFWLGMQRFLVRRRVENLHLSEIGFIGGLGGLIQVAVVLAEIPIIGLTSDVGSTKRILGSVIAATFWLPIQSVAGRTKL